LKKLINQDPDLYKQIQAIISMVRNNFVDYRKFESLKSLVVPEKPIVIKYGSKHRITMTDRDFEGACQQFFNDEILIKLICEFCKSDDESGNIDFEKLSFLNEVITYLP
jgi:hypothetical protein